MIRLYVIDDDFLVHDGLCSSLKDELDRLEVAGVSFFIEDAITKIPRLEVDIILLDLYLKCLDPVKNFLRIHQAFPEIPTVILSSECCLLWQLEMFRLGAHAYIHKGEDFTSICQKLMRVANGDVVIPCEVNRILRLGNGSNSGLQSIPGFLEIILGLDNRMGIGEIAKKLNQSCSSVEKTLQKIRNCFDVQSNADLLRKAMSGHNSLLY